MVDALSATVSFMNGDIQRMNVIGQNLANVSTIGYKRLLTVGRSFADFLSISDASAANGIFPVALPTFETVPDVQSGAFRSTASTLDFAIEGKGFFEIGTDAGSRYTRQGDFRLDSTGRLVTDSGFPVMGVSGEIVLKSNQISVDSEGHITEAGRQVGQLRTVRFSDPQSLINLGSGLFAAGEHSTKTGDGTDRIRQSFLEASNVNSTGEMVKMIETVRHFEAGQKVVQAYDEMMDRALTKLGDF